LIVDIPREIQKKASKKTDEARRSIFIFSPFSHCAGAFSQVSQKNFSYALIHSLLCKYVSIIREKERSYITLITLTHGS
jgi:hypothetical protein